MQRGYSTLITENGGYVDLHMHTKLSDGNLSVEELLTLCKRKGLRCISITDHDNLDSYNLAVEPAKEIGLEIIPGMKRDWTERNPFGKDRMSVSLMLSHCGVRTDVLDEKAVLAELQRIFDLLLQAFPRQIRSVGLFDQLPILRQEFT